MDPLRRFSPGILLFTQRQRLGTVLLCERAEAAGRFPNRPPAAASAKCTALIVRKV